MDSQRDEQQTTLLRKKLYEIKFEILEQRDFFNRKFENEIRRLNELKFKQASYLRQVATSVSQIDTEVLGEYYLRKQKMKEQYIISDSSDEEVEKAGKTSPKRKLKPKRIKFEDPVSKKLKRLIVCSTCGVSIQLHHWQHMSPFKFVKKMVPVASDDNQSEVSTMFSL